VNEAQVSEGARVRLGRVRSGDRVEEGVAAAVEFSELGHGSLGEDMAGRLVWGEGLAVDEEDRKRALAPGAEDLAERMAWSGQRTNRHGLHTTPRSLRETQRAVPSPV